MIIPINKSTHERLERFEDGKTDFVLFRTPGYDETLFVSCHGWTDGTLVCQVSNEVYTSLQFLEMLIKEKGIVEKGIKEVLTMSCHGGLQQAHEINGITIKSLHQSHGEISSRSYALFDCDEYEFVLSVPE